MSFCLPSAPAQTVLAVSAALLFVITGCSLDYGKAENYEDEIPELSFSQAQFNRFDDNRKTMQIQAEQIEQYKNENSSFAHNVQFKTWNKKGELDTEGSCGLVAADATKEQYNLFDRISVKVYGQNIRLIAENLRWNGKTEQLTSGKNDTVSIERDDVTVTGKGFSASGVSRSFAFAKSVGGTITTKDAATANTDTTNAVASTNDAANTNAATVSSTDTQTKEKGDKQ